MPGQPSALSAALGMAEQPSAAVLGRCPLLLEPEPLGPALHDRKVEPGPQHPDHHDDARQHGRHHHVRPPVDHCLQDCVCYLFRSHASCRCLVHHSIGGAAASEGVHRQVGADVARRDDAHVDILVRHFRQQGVKEGLGRVLRRGVCGSKGESDFSLDAADGHDAAFLRLQHAGQDGFGEGNVSKVVDHHQLDVHLDGGLAGLTAVADAATVHQDVHPSVDLQRLLRPVRDVGQVGQVQLDHGRGMPPRRLGRVQQFLSDPLQLANTSRRQDDLAARRIELVCQRFSKSGAGSGDEDHLVLEAASLERAPLEPVQLVHHVGKHQGQADAAGKEAHPVQDPRHCVQFSHLQQGTVSYNKPSATESPPSYSCLLPAVCAITGDNR
uniref:Uncharacterized protein n=1 Tax=Ixodes ricinus TaxID=34613 RepID=A0A6B0VAX9_IXORI